MVFIFTESFLHHTLETFTTEEKRALKKQVYSIPGLSLNMNTKISKDIVQNLLNSELKDRNNVVFWNDVISNSFSRQKSNGFRSLSVPELSAILKQLKNRLRALVYCHCDWTPKILEELKKQIFTVLHIQKDFVSSWKQNDQDFLEQFRELHQSPQLELKHLRFWIRIDCDPPRIGPERPSKRARKAINNASPVVIEE